MMRLINIDTLKMQKIPPDGCCTKILTVTSRFPIEPKMRWIYFIRTKEVEDDFRFGVFMTNSEKIVFSTYQLK